MQVPEAFPPGLKPYVFACLNGGAEATPQQSNNLIKDSLVSPGACEIFQEVTTLKETHHEDVASYPASPFSQQPHPGHLCCLYAVCRTWNFAYLQYMIAESAISAGLWAPR
jgi:hypothetical protein